MQVLIKESSKDKAYTYEYFTNTNKKTFILSDSKVILKKLRKLISAFILLDSWTV